MDLNIHKTNPVNQELEIALGDEPGAGGAHHHYIITGFDLSSNPSAVDDDGDLLAAPDVEYLFFQNGPIKEVGVNGLTHEVLLAILIHRLQCFQNGPYANKYNLEAVSHLQEALKAFKARTEERTERGVEGTHGL
jgi:hypothetical protein